jgi:hypothetical protein
MTATAAPKPNFHRRMTTELSALAPPWVELSPSRNLTDPDEKQRERCRKYRENNKSRLRQYGRAQYVAGKKRALDPETGVLAAYFEYLDNAAKAGVVPE